MEDAFPVQYSGKQCNSQLGTNQAATIIGWAGASHGMNNGVVLGVANLFSPRLSIAR